MSLHKDEHARNKGHVVTFKDAQTKGQTKVKRLVKSNSE